MLSCALSTCNPWQTSMAAVSLVSPVSFLNANPKIAISCPTRYWTWTTRPCSQTCSSGYNWYEQPASTNWQHGTTHCIHRCTPNSRYVYASTTNRIQSENLSRRLTRLQARRPLWPRRRLTWHSQTKSSAPRKHSRPATLSPQCVSLRVCTAEIK